MAAILGRNFVLPDDVKRVATAVLTHRLILRPESRLRKVTARRGGRGSDRRNAACRSHADVERRREQRFEPITVRSLMRLVCRARISVVASRPGFRLGLAGLCDVRAAGHHARQPLAEPRLDRKPDGQARVQSAFGQRRRPGGRGDHVQNRGVLPIAWLLIEDLLPRRR